MTTQKIKPATRYLGIPQPEPPRGSKEWFKRQREERRRKPIVPEERIALEEPEDYIFDYKLDKFVPATKEQVAERERLYERFPEVGPPGAPGRITPAEYERLRALDLEERERERLEFIEPFEAVFPEEDIEALLRGMAVYPEMLEPERLRAEQAQDDFLNTLAQVGRTPDTEVILRQMGATEEQIAEFFPPEVEAFTPAITMEGEVIEQGFWGSFWDAIRLESKRALHLTAQYFVSTLPNFIFRDVKAGEEKVVDGKRFGLVYTPEEAERANQFAKKMRDTFRPTYARNQVKFEEWVEKHPEFQPPPQAEKDITKNWELLKDPAYMGNVIGSAIPFMTGILAVSLGTLYVTKNPVWAGLAATAFATPLQSQDLADELIQYGAPEDEAAQLAVPIGAAIASVEMVGNFPILKIASPFFKSLGGNIRKEVARRTVLELIKRFGKNFTMVEVGEVLEEIIQGIIQDVTVKTYDEERDVFEKIDETAIKTLIATAPLAIFGGAVSLRRVSPQEAVTVPDEQKKTEGWKQDNNTGEWYKPEKIIDSFNEYVARAKEEGLTEEQAGLSAFNEVSRTPEGEKAISEFIEKLAVPEAVPEVIPEIAFPQAVLNHITDKINTRTGLAARLATFTDETYANLAKLSKDELEARWDEQYPPNRERAMASIEEAFRQSKGEKPSPIIPKPKPPVVEEVKPEVFVTEEMWGTMPEQSRAKALAEAGLDRKLATKGWNELTPSQREALGFEEVKPPVIEEAPERIVYTEGGVPVSPDEPISQEVADNIPIIQDIGVKERARPTRKVFERLDLYVPYKGIQRAEVELGEAKVAFTKKLKEVSKLVDKKRRYLVFRELENPGSQVGLTFNEKRVVSFFGENFNKWADKLNLPQEKRVKNYITHIFEADIAEQLKAKHPIDPAIARALEYKAPKTIFNPFLQERLGATTGLVEDPFAAASAYESRQLKVFYYEPMLQKIAVIANDINTPRSVRGYLKDYSRRMTDEPARIDTEINTTLQEFADKIRGLPGGEGLANFMSRGNPSGMAAYNFTSVIYTLWLGFKPTSAIRNLSQHTLIIGEVGPVHFADGIRLRLTSEGKVALNESLVLRSRKAAFVPGIDDSFAERWTDKFRESALWMFRMADKQNVSDAFLAGYSEAKSLLPEADRQVWIDRGDEVAADTQYLYTKMNSMAISQSSIGRVFSILTTWSENWMELMTKWVSRRPSTVYLQYEKETGKTLPKKNWSQTYKAIVMYMAIIGLGYAIKERERLKAWEYTGITSIKYLADVAGGDFPGLQAPGAVANIIAGFLTDDERRLKTGWAEFKGTFTPGIVRQLEDVAMGEKDWLTLFFYLEGRDYHIKQLKNKWEKGWKDYEAIEKASERDDYRKNNPLIEAQMFITSKFTTLTTDKARAEVLRIIEENELDTELIDGYDKVFGVDTDKKFTGFRKLLGTVELDDEGKQKVKENGELDYYTTSNFASDVNKLEKVVGRYKVEKDGNALAIEYLRAKDLFVQYESLTEDDARVLYRQQFPDVEAQLYLWGKISTFKNPKSTEILLGLMEKYNISPESIPAFLDNPEKYDELFTQKFKLGKKWFDLNTEYANLGNSESEIYIEDDRLRQEARERLKDANPDWIADMRRIEAIDHDASDIIIEEWAKRGKIIDEHGGSSSEAKVWLIDHEEVWDWALGQKLLTDLGGDWNIPVLRINVKWRKQDEEYNEGIPARFGHIENIDERQDKIAQAREDFLADNPEYHKDAYRRNAYSIVGPAPDYNKFPEGQIETYVQWNTDDFLKRPEDYKWDWYEDDWWLQEHPEFHQALVDTGGWKEKRDFTKVPTKEVYKLYLIYTGLPLGQIRLDYRTQNPDLNKWLVNVKGLKPLEGRGDKEADLSRWEELAKTLAEIQERLRKLRG